MPAEPVEETVTIGGTELARGRLRVSQPLSFFSLQRLCLNGSTGQEVIINSGLETVEALAFEPLSQLLYWVDSGFKKIEVRVSRAVRN